MPAFAPTRAAALDRLSACLSDLGARYGAQRNFDVNPPTTSALSPWVRRRIITEPEVLRAVLNMHGAQECDRFVTEVIWRSYWKGWLEMRPSVWATYRRDLDVALNRVQTESGLRAQVRAACLGQTGIACFDHWAQQLSDTGWLHNHARMWFASIWIFTLRLPWQLGADLFLRQLLDGDPASNTLGWRWVAGIQTRGKHYIATAENIRRFTNGTFDPRGMLNEKPLPIDAPEPPAPGPLPISVPIRSGLRTGVLISSEDLSPEPLLDTEPLAVFALDTAPRLSPLKIAAQVANFSAEALRDRAGPCSEVPVTFGSGADSFREWVESNALEQVVFAYAPTGPGRDALADLARHAGNIHFSPQVRAYDGALWPHAQRGFFRFRKDIPDIATLV